MKEFWRTISFAWLVSELLQTQSFWIISMNPFRDGAWRNTECYTDNSTHDARSQLILVSRCDEGHGEQKYVAPTPLHLEKVQKWVGRILAMMKTLGDLSIVSKGNFIRGKGKTIANGKNGCLKREKGEYIDEAQEWITVLLTNTRLRLNYYIRLKDERQIELRSYKRYSYTTLCNALRHGLQTAMTKFPLQFQCGLNRRWNDSRCMRLQGYILL